MDAGTPDPQNPPSALFAGPETVVYVDSDAVGSVRMLTDQNGGVVARYDYLPFGTLWNAPALQTSLAFALTERDVATGQDYAAARYFEANLGRFTSVDPDHVAGNLYDPQSWNGYAYAHNNPLRWVDPTGEDPPVLDEPGDHVLRQHNGNATAATVATAQHRLGFRTLLLR